MNKAQFLRLKKSLFISLFICTLSFSSCGDDDSPQEVTGAGDFVTQAGAAQISGSLFLPEGDGPFPVMIIVPGSGNEPKEDSYPFNDIFLPQGIAVYHYDKRGIGQSTGSYPAESLENPFDFLNARRDDVVGIVDLMNMHAQIDKERIGLLGASQGAWVNSLVFEQRSNVDFIIMSVGGAAPTGIENLYNNLTNDPTVSIDDAIAQLADYTGPLGFVPENILTGMEIPVAWIFGGQDRSHPTFYDIPILERLNKSNFTVFLLETADHELLDVNTNQLHAELFPTLFNWFNQNVR